MAGNRIKNKAQNIKSYFFFLVFYVFSLVLVGLTVYKYAKIPIEETKVYGKKLRELENKQDVANLFNDKMKEMLKEIEEKDNVEQIRIISNTLTELTSKFEDLNKDRDPNQKIDYAGFIGVLRELEKTRQSCLESLQCRSDLEMCRDNLRDVKQDLRNCQQSLKICSE